MDFTNRAGSRPTSSQQVVSPSDSGSGHDGGNKKKTSKGLPFLDLASSLLFIAVAVVVLGLTLFLIFFNESSEEDFIDESKLQAVFLNGGQVYFGNITDVNSNKLVLTNVYYLRVNQQVQPKQGTSQATGQDISLVKLGCELHGPDDFMVMNREQVLFWENLKKDSQVTEAVKQYVEANPQGQDCSVQTSDNNSNGGGDSNTVDEADQGASEEDTGTETDTTQ